MGYCRQCYHLSRPWLMGCNSRVQIKKDVLAYRFGGETAEQWLAIFREYRWDLEEEAEALILAQQEDDHGWIWLS